MEVRALGGAAVRVLRAVRDVLARPSGTVRTCVLLGLLAVSGAAILELVREETGTPGFFVGLGLALLPVPVLMAAFRWLGRVTPGPWPYLLYAFGWGACAAALIAILANSFATEWIAGATADPSDADQLGSIAIAPVVEESAKAAALLLVFLFRRQRLCGIADGIVLAGFTATGFAFTENILYLGNAFGEDLGSGIGVLDSLTAATFFVRIMLSPFAHPLFTVLTGIGFGAAALCARRPGRVVLPLSGLTLAMGVHALWNSSSELGEYGFYVVYGSVMVPAFGLLVWLALWTRRRRLRTLGSELAVYAAAGWLAPAEVPALASMPARSLARVLARNAGGRTAGRVVAAYQADAAELALLRHRARRGGPAGVPEFVERERELLDRMWLYRPVAGPVLVRAAVLEELVPAPSAPSGQSAQAGAAARRLLPGPRPVPAAAVPLARPPALPVVLPVARRSGPWTPARTADPSSSPRPCALPGADGPR